MDAAVPDEVSLRDPADFRWIRQPLLRFDVRDKSTGQAEYGIDTEVDGMLNAAVRHAPRLGQTPASLGNRDAVEGMRGVHSVHLLDGAVAVLADKFWQALRATDGPGVEIEAEGDAAGMLDRKETVIEAGYDAPFLAHGHLGPPSTVARFNEDGTLSP